MNTAAETVPTALDLSALTELQLARLNTSAYRAGLRFDDWQNAKGYEELREMLPELPDQIREVVARVLTSGEVRRQALRQIRRATLAAGCLRWPI